ncbi:hypothetical protein BC008_05125 [Mastigocoleus testarum BC008]|uniref:Uncharacterized protein n=1 Tax=Mastigocoleus testarum BC008 TaxID=371196 RepID=A0A0V7ZYZ1_9CYAN|nr:hypothetical protein BC008_05125 [Mastigocoleus testarum BC008]
MQIFLCQVLKSHLYDLLFLVIKFLKGEMTAIFTGTMMICRDVAEPAASALASATSLQQAKTNGTKH